MPNSISFKCQQFKKEIILILVRWYLAYFLSYRDIEELPAERGLQVDHSTIHRWVIHYSPQLEKSFRQNHKRITNASYRVDETYLEIKGKDVYLYRAVDKFGKTINFKLSEKRDKKAAFSFFQKCIYQNELSEGVTLDKSGANKAGINLIQFQLNLFYLFTCIFLSIEVRKIKYLNNIIEQDHRFIKKTTMPMKGFKSFHSAQATLAGIETHHMLRKRQHRKSQLQSIHEQLIGLAA